MRIILLLALFTLPFSAVKAEERFLDIQEIQSESGLKAWLVEDNTLPIIALQFSFIGAGTKNDPANKQGRAKLLSNMLDEGAGDLESQNYQKQLSDHSISLSFSASRDHFTGQVKTLSRYKDKAFNLLKLALNEPRFDEEPLERMKKANISRIKSSLTDPNWIAARIENDLIYGDHPYALNSGGTITSLNAITTSDLKEFKSNFLTKERLVIGIMGDITAQEASKLLDSLFGGISQSSKPSKSPINIEPQTGTFLYNKDIPQTIINVTMPAFDRHDPDFYAAQVFNYILGGGGFGSRLMETAREKEGLTYGIYSGIGYLDEAQNFSISTSTQNDKAARMIEIIHAEIDKIKNNAITKDELQNAKSYLTGSLPLSLTSTNKIAGLLRALQQNKRDITYLDEYAASINAVTIGDIQRVAKRILDKNKITTVLVGQPNGIEDMTEIKDLPNVQ